MKSFQLSLFNLLDMIEVFILSLHGYLVTMHMRAIIFLCIVVL